MTKLKWTAVAIGAAVWLAGAGARAQDAPVAFGQARQVVISGERLFGYVHSEATSSATGADRTTTIDSLSLLGNTLSALTRFAGPRVAFDFFASDRFSIGAAATYLNAGESQSMAAGQSAANPSFSGFLLAPRAGFALALGHALSWWPRVGFTFARLSADIPGAGVAGAATHQTTTTDVYALTVEAPLVFALAPHFFLSAAPTLELGLGGSASALFAAGGNVTMQNGNAKETDLGVLCALGGFF
jgi:hypothetical protein